MVEFSPTLAPESNRARLTSGSTSEDFESFSLFSDEGVSGESMEPADDGIPCCLGVRFLVLVDGDSLTLGGTTVARQEFSFSSASSESESDRLLTPLFFFALAVALRFLESVLDEESGIC